MTMPAVKQPEAGPLSRAISEEIRVTLTRKRLTAKQLAIQCELSPTYLNKRLRGEASFTLNDLETIAEQLGGDLDAFRRAAIEAMQSSPETGSEQPG